MSKLVLNGDTSGSVTLDAPAVSGTTTLTLPTQSGTIITTGSTFGGTGPAFFATPSTNQTLSNNTNTKILFQNEQFDTNSNFASSTFTPTVAGYYLISAQIACISANSSEISLRIFKNGSEYTRVGRLAPTGQTVYFGNSALVSMNGSTDYLEMYVYTATGFTLESPYSLFSGFLARSA